MPSVILPVARFEPKADSASVLVEPASGNLLAQVVRRGNIQVENDLKMRNYYTHGFLNSYSVYTHTHGLNLGTNKTLFQLLEDIDHYIFEPHLGVDFEEYTLLTDGVRLAETQVWTTRTYTLAQTPDSSLPHFPEEDFEG
jgi:hypothetical protein